MDKEGGRSAYSLFFFFWFKEERNSIIGGYIIDYSEKDPPNNQEHEVKLDNADLLFFTITGLTPYTEYKITVQPFAQQLQNGHGPKSEPIYRFTS